MKEYRFKKCREDNNLTQEQLAEKLDLTVRAIAAWERGERKPPIDKLEKLADLYDVSIDYLLGRTPVPQVNTFRRKTIIASPLGKQPVILTNRLNFSEDNTIKPIDEISNVSMQQLKNLVKQMVKSEMDNHITTGVLIEKPDGSQQHLNIKGGPIDVNHVNFEQTKKLFHKDNTKHTFRVKK